MKRGILTEVVAWSNTSASSTNEGMFKRKRGPCFYPTLRVMQLLSAKLNLQDGMTWRTFAKSPPAFPMSNILTSEKGLEQSLNGTPMRRRGQEIVVALVRDRRWTSSNGLSFSQRFPSLQRCTASNPSMKLRRGHWKYFRAHGFISSDERFYSRPGK